MINRPDTNAQRLKRHKRVRGKISGTPERPRLNVFRSNTNIYAQVIDDVTGKTLVSASSLEKGFEGKGSDCEAAKKVAWLSRSAPRPPALRPSCLTAAATCTTAACRPWPRVPVRAACSSKGGGKR